MARGIRVSLAALADDVDDTPPIHTNQSGGGAAAAVPLDELTPNPRNPREDLGDLRDLASIVDMQLQPVVTVSKSAYQQLFPDDDIHTPWVVINGCRRYAAAVKYGRADLEMVVKDELARDRATLLTAAIRENVERLDFDVIEEATAVAALVAECGTARAAAKMLHKTEAWVSQRRALLHLAPDLQAALKRGELAIRTARTLAQVPLERQVLAWQAAREREEHKADSAAGDGAAAGPTPAPRYRAVTAALRTFHAEPAQLATALRDALGDDGVATLVAALRRRK